MKPAPHLGITSGTFPENLGETKVLADVPVKKEAPDYMKTPDELKAAQEGLEKKTYTDKERLDHLQSILNRREEKCVCRWALNSSGFVIHPSNTHEKRRPNIRVAIDRFIQEDGDDRRAGNEFHGEGKHRYGRKRPTD